MVEWCTWLADAPVKKLRHLVTFLAPNRAPQCQIFTTIPQCLFSLLPLGLFSSRYSDPGAVPGPVPDFTPYLAVVIYLPTYLPHHLGNCRTVSITIVSPILEISGYFFKCPSFCFSLKTQTLKFTTHLLPYHYTNYV